jgi:hypothetical protein
MWDYIWNFSNPFDQERQFFPNDSYAIWLPPVPDNAVFQGKYEKLGKLHHD